MNRNTLSLGDRMKKYEEAIDFKLNPCMQYIIRLDGKGFSKMIKKWKCEKPFDYRFNKAINYAARKLFSLVPNVKAIWHGSDEISIWFQCPNAEDMYEHRPGKRDLGWYRVTNQNKKAVKEDLW